MRSKLLGTTILVMILVWGAVGLRAATRFETAAAKVYEQMPNLERGELPGKPESTLVRRLMLYHASIRGRPETSRLDWKLTLSDYLGYNLNIDPATYPEYKAGQDTLARDRAAVDALSRRERNRLIDVLVFALQR
ncbi:hypothetical protein [Gloeobacter morelensis]|uniref:Uncharacterized protein n=1 Tax=Gloeobacter morelensis MG652769 TaxID=2781736 RepID=A0ABY3PIG5_9CYAN|nr:hypothetical protein [Gloeobacter morelensis]UFP93437.1 hypothetical protein ISF26_16770 [Gloeobacter morelensis MG652769]